MGKDSAKRLAIILCSGGIDSVVTAYHAKKKLKYNRIIILFFNYGQKALKQERVCSKRCAKNLGANVMGVNINESQLSKARALAEINGIQSLVHFIRRNFSDTGLESNSFDVVWGLESICYAEDKKVFLGEAKRVLKNNGRIVVADGFLKKSDLTKKERREMDIWLEGWAVPNLAEAQSFKKDLEELGFRNIVFKDITENVMPSSRRMYWAAVLAYPIAKLMCLVGLRTEVQMKNMDAAYYQQITLRDRLWFYGVFCATK